MKILFMGTPDFAVPSLRALVEAGHEICGVFTQPDKPKNRGMKLQITPVKEYAMSKNIPVFQPVKLRDGTAMQLIQELAPEMIAVAAYGRILPDDMLAYPEKGCINVHSSLLPKYRGAAPIQWAVLNGDTESGVTIMHMATELDAGDVIAQAATPISPNETAAELTARLAELGGDLLVNTIDQIMKGIASRTPQDTARVTFAPMLTRDMSPIDWTCPAVQIHNQIRGLLPWPAATTQLGGVRCKIFESQATAGQPGAMPGTVLAADQRGICVACGQNTALWIYSLQPDGKKRMPATDFLRGHSL